MNWEQALYIIEGGGIVTREVWKNQKTFIYCKEGVIKLYDHTNGMCACRGILENDPDFVDHEDYFELSQSESYYIFYGSTK